MYVRLKSFAGNKFTTEWSIACLLDHIATPPLIFRNKIINFSRKCNLTRFLEFRDVLLSQETAILNWVWETKRLIWRALPRLSWTDVWLVSHVPGIRGTRRNAFCRETRYYFTTPAYLVVSIRNRVLGQAAGIPIWQVTARFASSAELNFNYPRSIDRRVRDRVLSAWTSARDDRERDLYYIHRLDGYRKRIPVPGAGMGIANSVCAIECYVSRRIDRVEDRENSSAGYFILSSSIRRLYLLFK